MSINQSLRPVTTEKRDHIYIGGCDTVELAKKYGTPLYVLDEETIRGICREYKSAFKDYKNIRMMYACKSLCNLAVLRIVDDEGFGFDTVSSGEIYTAYKAGVNMEKVLFNGNNREVLFTCNTGNDMLRCAISLGNDHSALSRRVVCVSYVYGNFRTSYREYSRLVKYGSTHIG